MCQTRRIPSPQIGHTTLSVPGKETFIDGMAGSIMKPAQSHIQYLKTGRWKQMLNP